MRIAHALAASWLLVLSACGGDMGASLRKATYPPDFGYISPEQLRSTMWQLARDASALDRLGAKPDPISAADRAQILALLASMDAEAAKLGAEGVRTNHPLLDEQRDQFRADLAAARRGVEAEPPSYTLARTASTACMRCHHRSVR